MHVLLVVSFFYSLKFNFSLLVFLLTGNLSYYASPKSQIDEF